MEKENSNEEIPEMNIDKKYSDKPIIPPASELEKSMEKIKKGLGKIKSFIIKKYSYTQAIGILPKKAVNIFIEEEIGENLPKDKLEKLEKKIHLYVVVPEEKLKEIPKIKTEIIKQIEKEKQDVWVYVKTPVDIWESCLDSKFDMVGAIAMSFPLHDKGILKGLRVSEIHKTLVLQKFEKYVVSYVIAGSLIRGDTVEGSDIDAFVIINDTDVKRMPRLELKERLR